MFTQLNNILEVMSIAIGIFLLERYVFLEPNMEAKRQRLFYLISVLCIIAVFILLGKDAASIVAILLGGLNISLGRTKHRLRGFLLTIPLPGIINGLMVPIIIIPPYLFEFSDMEIQLYSFMVFSVLAVLLLLFWKKGENWRIWFKEHVQNRSMYWWEKSLLCVCGTLMMFFSDTIVRQLILNRQLKEQGWENAINGAFAADICIWGMIAFVLTFTMITLIMQGNKRNSYYEQVQDMQYNMIASMADLVENRDENTGGHIKRTSEYVKVIAKKLMEQNSFPDILTKQYLSDMVVAAPLHDIGKIHIPDSILNKPGRLTDEEFDIMKSHAMVGYELLQKITEQMGESAYLKLAADMAKYHHEWWNGNGYPEHIKGDDIPLCARIMAVADVFDALTSKRCYKEAMPVEKAYSIIREESGTHFDPVVAEAFLASTETIYSVMKNN